MTEDDRKADGKGRSPPTRDERDLTVRLLERLRGFRGRLTSDFKFDRDEANSR